MIIFKQSAKKTNKLGPASGYNIAEKHNIHGLKKIAYLFQGCALRKIEGSPVL